MSLPVAPPRGARRLAPALRAILAAGAAAGAITLLHAVGQRDLAAPPVGSFDELRAWVETRDPAAVGFALLRLVALGAAYHLVLTTAVMGLGRMLHRPGLVRLGEASTLPALRGPARRLAGLGLSAGILLTPQIPTATASPPAATATADRSNADLTAAERSNGVLSTATLERVDATTPGRATLSVEEDPDEASTPIGPPSGTATLERTDTSNPAPHTETPDLTDESDPTPDDQILAPAEDPTDRREPGGPMDDSVYRVRTGDHLWSIAEQHLAGALGRTPTDQEIAPHWMAIVEANPQVGDPDVLHPGDQVNLPPAT